jgi:secretion/DNA translocation related TadE-like protein
MRVPTRGRRRVSADPPDDGSREPSRSQHERGSVTVVTAAIVGIVVVLTLGAADLGAVLVAREHAHQAADAAALAAAQELALPSAGSPQDQAAAFARHNGASLVACTCAPGSLEALVEVEVDVGHLFLLPGAHLVRSSARAVVDLAQAS